uniref:Uncharacterized protein n=1 Tax=Tetranychus urticae TaxID=32264 RepID=T1JU73_TETUR
MSLSKEFHLFPESKHSIVNFKDQQSTLIVQYLVQNNLVYRNYQDWPILQLFNKIFASIGFVVGCIVLLSSTSILVSRIYMTGSIINEINNAIFFTCLTASGDLATYYDQFFYNPVTFSAKFDEIWKDLMLSGENQVRHDIKQIRRQQRKDVIIFSLGQFWLIIALGIFAPEAKVYWVKIAQYGRRILLFIAAFYYITLVDHLGTCSAFINSAYNSLSRQTKRLSRIRLTMLQDSDRVDQMIYIRNNYEKIGRLIELVNQTHSIFVGAFYLLVIPKCVTLVYDLIYTSSSYLVYHITELFFQALRLLVITRSISMIPAYTTKPRMSILNVSLSTKDPSLIIESELFLQRIYHQSFGITIFGKMLVCPSITGTLITAVVTYFIGIASFNAGSIVSSPTSPDVIQIE